MTRHACWGRRRHGKSGLRMRFGSSSGWQCRIIVGLQRGCIGMECTVTQFVPSVISSQKPSIIFCLLVSLATPFAGVERCVPRTMDPQVAKARRKAFDSLCALMARCIWLHPNDVFLGALDHLYN
jgi:hypothetical protein